MSIMISKECAAFGKLLSSTAARGIALDSTVIYATEKCFQTQAFKKTWSLWDMLDSKMKMQNIIDCILKGCKRIPKQSTYVAMFFPHLFHRHLYKFACMNLLSLAHWDGPTFYNIFDNIRLMNLHYWEKVVQFSPTTSNINTAQLNKFNAKI